MQRSLTREQCGAITTFDLGTLGIDILGVLDHLILVFYFMNIF